MPKRCALGSDSRARGSLRVLLPLPQTLSVASGFQTQEVRGKRRKSFRNRIESAFAKRRATTNAPRAEEGAFERPVPLDGPDSISRASRKKSAGRRKRGRNRALIKANQRNEQPRNRSRSKRHLARFLSHKGSGSTARSQLSTIENGSGTDALFQSSGRTRIGRGRRSRSRFISYFPPFERRRFDFWRFRLFALIRAIHAFSQTP